MTNGPNVTIEAQGYKLFTISDLQMHEVNLIKKKLIRFFKTELYKE